MTLPGEPNREAKRRVLFQLAALFKNASMTYNAEVIHRARVPLISFETVPELGYFKVDISINADDGVKAIPLISHYLDNMSALRYLVSVVKGYLSHTKLNNAANGGLSSYSVICLAISFLQLNHKGRPLEDIEKPLERESLGRLLLDFFEYYGSTFDYANSCVSVSQGKLVSKESKGWKRPTDPESLSIECLVNHDHDVGRPTGKIKQIKAAFQEAYTILQDLPFPMLQANTLGAIMGISPATMERRAYLETISNSGSLEEALRRSTLSSSQTRPSRLQYPPVKRPILGQHILSPPNANVAGSSNVKPRRSRRSDEERRAKMRHT